MYPSDEFDVRIAIARARVRQLQRRAEELLQLAREHFRPDAPRPPARPPDPLPPRDTAARLRNVTRQGRG
jgi:hypothetical protein